MPNLSYWARIVAIPERSASSREDNARGRPWKDASNLPSARGYDLKSQAASVMTGQDVKRAPNTLKLVDALLVVLAGLREDSHQRAGVYQYLALQERILRSVLGWC
jgi:hypothetical protein